VGVRLPPLVPLTIHLLKIKFGVGLMVDRSAPCL